MKAKSIPLSKPRRLVCDLLHFAKELPTAPVQRRINISRLMDARSALANRPSWTAIFTKAFAIVSEEMPELRRAFVKWPTHRLIEYPRSAATIAVERDFEGEKAVFLARVRQPSEASLIEITELLNLYREKPVHEVREFRRALRIAAWPRFIRRWLWRLALNLPRCRARLFGTFSVSVYSALGAESLHPLAPVTCLLNYGVFSPEGEVNVRIVYDHRVFDGATAARALARMEDVLSTELCRELATSAGRSASTTFAAPGSAGSKELAREPFLIACVPAK